MDFSCPGPDTFRIHRTISIPLFVMAGTIRLANTGQQGVHRTGQLQSHVPGSVVLEIASEHGLLDLHSGAGHSPHFACAGILA